MGFVELEIATLARHPDQEIDEKDEEIGQEKTPERRERNRKKVKRRVSLLTICGQLYYVIYNYTVQSGWRHDTVSVPVLVLITTQSQSVPGSVNLQLKQRLDSDTETYVTELQNHVLHSKSQ